MGKGRQVPTRKSEEGKFAQALEDALRISQPWYRSQSLASIVEFAPEKEVSRIAEMSFKAAKEGRDAYQRVAVTAWIFYALTKRDMESLAAKYLPDILADAHRITPSPSKVEALYNVWNALGDAPKLRALAQVILVSACDAANTWRAGRVMRTVVTIVALTNRAEAEALWARMPEKRYKRQTRRMLEAGQVEPTRSY